MVRRVVEEDVVTPNNTTVVEDDGSWIGRTIVTLVVLALLVAGAVWLVRAMSDDNNGVGDGRDTEQNGNTTDDQTNNDPGTDTDTDTDTTLPTAIPS